MQTELSKPNTIHCGDNLAIMQEMESESVDLIYLDPPFFSGRNYEVIWNDGTEERSFKDTEWYRVECPDCSREVVKAERFCPACGTDLTNAKVTRKNDIYAYIDWMVPRLTEMHRILKPTGSIYLHVDWHAVHYLKIEMDRIFGMGNFKNEIVWGYSGGGVPKTAFARKHDTILMYSKTTTKDRVFNIQYMPYSDASQKLVKNRGGISIDGKIRDLKRGAHMNDWWTDLNALQTWSPEKLGYPTQKPEALLERIILASSNQGDVVFDPFCGCGTTLAVASRLKRSYIGIDISPTSCMVIADRINHRDRIMGMKYSDEEYMSMAPHEFQNIVCNVLHAKNTSPNPKNASGADGGIDGIVKSEVFTINYAGAPIQVKRSKNVGVNTIKNLEATMLHLKNQPKVGFVVAISFGSGARKQAKQAKAIGLNIILLEAKDLYTFSFETITQ